MNPTEEQGSSSGVPYVIPRTGLHEYVTRPDTSLARQKGMLE